jgi:hypothetical protein
MQNQVNRIEPNRWYTAREVERFLNVKEQTITRYCRTGELNPAEKRGPRQQWYIKGAAIIRLRNRWKLSSQ